jgi:hypothetical protein
MFFVKYAACKDAYADSVILPIFMLYKNVKLSL